MLLRNKIYAILKYPSKFSRWIFFLFIINKGKYKRPRCRKSGKVDVEKVEKVDVEKETQSVLKALNLINIYSLKLNIWEEKTGLEEIEFVSAKGRINA